MFSKDMKIDFSLPRNFEQEIAFIGKRIKGKKLILGIKKSSRKPAKGPKASAGTALYDPALKYCLSIKVFACIYFYLN